jgi:transposase
MASRLFGLDGFRVVEVDVEADGSRTVWVQTDDLDARRCPECGVADGRVKDVDVTSPVDVGWGFVPVRVRWMKRRWECLTSWCPVATFTEATPQVPARCRFTGRLREQAAACVADFGMTVTDAAAASQMSWPTAHQALAEQADQVLDREMDPVCALGIDETHRGDPVWEIDPVSGAWERVVDRWNIGFVDILGGQGLLGQVNGRTADDVAHWLATRSPAWRQAVDYVTIDMCSVFKSAIGRMLPKAQIALDAFHVVQLGNRAMDQVRRRAVRKKYGRPGRGGRGRRGDEENMLISVLRMNREQVDPVEVERVRAVLSRDVPGRMILVGWDAKELLRDVIKMRESISGMVPDPAGVERAMEVFLDFCHIHRWIPEIATLAATVRRWRREIVCGVVSGISNAKSEGVNRIIKQEQTKAGGFRNPANQQRRNRVASTRSHRRSQRATNKRSLAVTKREHNPA